MRAFLLFLFGSFILLTFPFSTVRAAGIGRTDTFEIKPNQTVTGNQYIRANTVIIDGTLDGDLNVLTSDLEIKGSVSGNVSGASLVTTISGKIDGSLLLASSNLTLNGVIVKDTAVLANSFQVSKKASLQGTLLYAAVQSQVNSVPKQGIERYDLLQTDSFSWSDYLYQLIRTFLALGLLGVILYSIQPFYFTEQLVSSSPSSFLPLFFRGFLTFLLSLFIIPLLIFTVVGKWVGIVLLCSVVSLLLISLIDTSYLIGQSLFGRFLLFPQHLVLKFLIGLLIFCLLFSLPLLFFVALAIWFFCFGKRVLFLQDYLKNIHTHV